MAAAQIPISQSESAALLAHSFNRAEAYSRASKAEATRRGYRSDWGQFVAWCASAGPRGRFRQRPETVALSHPACWRNDAKPATIRPAHGLDRECAQRTRLSFAGSPSAASAPSLRCWQGIKPNAGHCPDTKAADPELRTCARWSRTAIRRRIGSIGTRDRALLLVGFARRDFAAASSWASTSRIVASAPTVLLQSLCAGRKPTRKAPAARWAFPYGLEPRDVPSARHASLAGDLCAPHRRPTVFVWVNRHGRMQPGRLSGTAIALIVKRHAGAARPRCCTVCRPQPPAPRRPGDPSGNGRRFRGNARS